MYWLNDQFLLKGKSKPSREANKMTYYNEGEILLVNPTEMSGWAREKGGRHFFPLILLYLQNYLLKHGIPCTTIDIVPEGLNPDTFKEAVLKYNPKVIGFTGEPYWRHSLHQYIIDIKSYAPGALVIVGGHYFAATAKECLTHLTDVDVVVRGEGEVALLELVQAFAQNKSFKDILGITYRDKSGNIVENKARPPGNRDECEVDPERIPNDSTYTPFVPLRNYEKEGILALPILLARGCTNKCTFCYNRASGRFNSRSIPAIIEEIQSKRKLFNCDNFWVIDPTFTLRQNFASELCKALKEHCPGINWTCDARADCGLALLNEMAEAGCNSIAYALESGSPKVLKAIKKDLDVSSIIEFAKESKRLGMRGLVFVMYSMPEETYNDFQMTMNVLKRIKPYIYDIDVHHLHILPGTELEEQARSVGILPSNFSWYDPNFKPVLEWKLLMSEKEIAKCRKTLLDYQYLLHHSKVKYVRKKLKNYLLITSFHRNETVFKAVHKFPAIHKFLRSSMEWVFGSDN